MSGHKGAQGNKSFHLEWLSRGGEVQFGFWFGLNSHVIQNSYTRILSPNGTIFGSKLGLDRLRVEPLRMELRSLITVSRKPASSILPSKENTDRTITHEPGSRASQDTISASILLLAFPELSEKHWRHCRGLDMICAQESMSPVTWMESWLRPIGSYGSQLSIAVTRYLT